MLTTSSKLKAGKSAGDLVAMSTFADWIEATILYQESPRLGHPDIVDYLQEEEICTSQTEAWAVLDSCVREMQRRSRLLSTSYPIAIHDNRFVRRGSWKDCTAYSFCLLLALAQALPDWAKSFGPNYTEQGELFELLTEYSLKSILKGWKIHRTGWSRTNASRIGQVVVRVAEIVNEPIGNVPRWTRASANEAGLDILCLRDFRDGVGGVPLYLFQCASGRDWEAKLATPNLDQWNRLIEFAAKPRRAFSTPFSFLEADMPQHINIVQGLFLDRFRLLEPARYRAEWLPVQFQRRLHAWSSPRIATLPWV